MDEESLTIALWKRDIDYYNSASWLARQEGRTWLAELRKHLAESRCSDLFHLQQQQQQREKPSDA